MISTDNAVSSCSELIHNSLKLKDTAKKYKDKMGNYYLVWEGACTLCNKPFKGAFLKLDKSIDSFFYIPEQELDIKFTAV